MIIEKTEAITYTYVLKEEEHRMLLKILGCHSYSSHVEMGISEDAAAWSAKFYSALLGAR